jgi:hypothetical protein
MNLSKRKIVAYIIGRLISGKEINKIFDQSESRYNEITGEVTPVRINVIASEKNEMITGSGDSKGISLFDYATSKFIDLKIDGKKFDGFDYESKKAFYGELKENTVSLFDFQDSKHHYFVMLEEGAEVNSGFGLLF